MSRRTRLLAWAQRRPTWWWPLVTIVGAVALANAAYLTGFTNGDPLFWTSGLATSVQCHMTCGRSMIDPNVGFLTQPLGYLSAHFVGTGQFPWWNPYQGLGQPLAGEMQSAALFPLAWLMFFPWGLLWFHISLELIAGIATWALLRRLGLSPFAATAAGVAFALNGTFAWIGNAVLNPVCFLPVVLLGVEWLVEAARSQKKGHWWLLAVGLAGSLVSGFPEVAYLNTVFAGLWVLVRYGSLRSRRPFIRGLTVGGLVGLGLSLPALVAFADFMKEAVTGNHADGGLALFHLPSTAVPMLMDPYVYGTIFSNPGAATAWGDIGGYFGFTAVALALVGLSSRRERGLVVMMGVFSLVALAGIFNVAGARRLWNLLPLVSQASLSRYIMPAVIFCVITLAAFGIDRLAVVRRPGGFLARRVLLSAFLLLVSLRVAFPVLHGAVLTTRQRILFSLLAATPWIAVAILLAIALLTSKKWRGPLVAIVLMGESVALFSVPTAVAPVSFTQDREPIVYLQQHLDSYRFVDVGRIFPNWGSQFGLSELSAIDLPFPARFSQEIKRHLNPTETNNNRLIGEGTVAQQQAYLALIGEQAHWYESDGAKYIVAPAALKVPASFAPAGITQAWTNGFTTVYQFAHPASLFSAPGCQVVTTSWHSASVTCTRPATVTYRELTMPGWRATRNDVATTITTHRLFQSIDLPRGTSEVNFSFTPPHMKLALVLALFAGAALFVGIWRDRRS